MSGFYRWQKAENNRFLKDKNDVELISKIFNEKHQKAGWRTIKMILENKYGKIMNHKKIKRIMFQYGLKTKIRQQSKHKAVFQKIQNVCVCSNVLNRDFAQTKPDRAFTTDVTYLFYDKGKPAYLSVIKDLGSKDVIACVLSEKNNLSLALDTLEKIPKSHNLNSALIHSDQGFAYTHPLYIQKIKELEMIQSMSRKGNCLDNAPVESFFGHLKDEINYKNCKTFEELKDKIDKYIYYYNNERYQWNLNKMTPMEYKYHLLTA